MATQKKAKRPRPPALRSQIKNWKRKGAEAEVLERLTTMDLAELVKLISGGPYPSLSGKAKENLERRTGLPWKQAVHQVRNRKSLEKQAEIRQLVSQYRLLTIEELNQRLAERDGDILLLRRVIREKQPAPESIIGAKPARRPRKGRNASVPRSLDAEPYSGPDYMKPNSEEFGMPEYDLE